MFEKVLFPTDFSVDSQKAFLSIRSIPGVRVVILLHVVDATDHSVIGVDHSRQLETAKSALAEEEKILKNYGLNVRTVINILVSSKEDGSVATNILDTAKKEDVSLIIMGARGKSLIRDLFLGSVSSEIMREAKTNVLILRGDPTRNCTAPVGEDTHTKIFSNLLVPTDFSQNASDVISFVTGIPGLEKVVLLHVVTESRRSDGWRFIMSGAQKKIGEFSKRLSGKGFQVSGKVRAGDPSKMILSAAEEECISLIAMSPHSRKWFEDSILGSTAFAVSNNSKTPVIIVRQKKP